MNNTNNKILIKMKNETISNKSNNNEETRSKKFHTNGMALFVHHMVKFHSLKYQSIYLIFFGKSKAKMPFFAILFAIKLEVLWVFNEVIKNEK